MPDGFGDNMPSWALSPHDRYDDEKILLALASHMREEHGMPLHRIAKRLGMPYKRLRIFFKGDKQ